MKYHIYRHGLNGTGFQVNRVGYHNIETAKAAMTFFIREFNKTSEYAHHRPGWWIVTEDENGRRLPRR